MARNISKSVFTSSITCMGIGSDGKLCEHTFTITGKASDNKALLESQKRFGNNVMVTNITHEGIKVTVDNETFYANSAPCIESESYGHDCIVQSFKTTRFVALHMVDGKMESVELHYYGTTTERKLRNAAVETLQDKNVLISDVQVIEEKRYMTKEKYQTLAK